MPGTFDPLNNTNPTIIDNIIIGEHSGKLTYENKRVIHGSSFMSKWIHWLKFPTERISHIQAFLAERNFFVSAASSLEKYANLYANLSYFNEHVIRKHNNSWISFLFPVHEIDPSALNQLETNLNHTLDEASEMLDGIESDFDQNFPHNFTLLTSVGKILSRTSALKHLRFSEPAKKRQNIFDTWSKQASIGIDAFHKQTQKLLLNKEWNTEDTQLFHTLIEFKQKLHLLASKTEDNVLVQAEIQTLEALETEFKKNSHEISDLQDKIYIKCAGLSTLAMGDSLEKLDFYKSCPDLQEQVNSFSNKRCVDNTTLVDLKKQSILYHSLVEAYGRIHELSTGFKASNTESLRTLEVKVNELNEFISSGLLIKYSLRTIYGDNAIFITAVKTALTKVNDRFKQIQTINKLIEKWLWIKTEMKTRMIAKTDIKDLAERTKECKQAFTDKNHPLYKKVKKLSGHLLKTIKTRDKEIKQWRSIIVIHSTRIQEALEKAMNLAIPFEPIGTFLIEDSFDQFIQTLPDSAVKQKLINRKNSLKQSLEDAVAACLLIRKVREKYSKLKQSGSPVSQADIESFLESNFEEVPERIKNRFGKFLESIRIELGRESRNFQSELLFVSNLLLKEPLAGNTFNVEINSLKLFFKTKKQDSIYNRIKALLNHRLIDKEMRDKLKAALDNALPEIFIQNIPLLEKCASFWEDKNTPPLSDDERTRLIEIYPDFAIPLPLITQLELIDRMHSLKFHARSICPISQGPLLDAVNPKTEIKDYFNRKDILQWIFDKQCNPCNRKELKPEQLEDANAVTLLVNDCRLFDELLLKRNSPASFKDILNQIAKDLPFKFTIIDNFPKQSDIDTLCLSIENLILKLNPGTNSKPYVPMILSITRTIKETSELEYSSYEEVMPKYLIKLSQMTEGLSTFKFCADRMDQYEDITAIQTTPLLQAILSRPDAFTKANFEEAHSFTKRLLFDSLTEVHHILQSDIWFKDLEKSFTSSIRYPEEVELNTVGLHQIDWCLIVDGLNNPEKYRRAASLEHYQELIANERRRIKSLV